MKINQQVSFILIGSNCERKLFILKEEAYRFLQTVCAHEMVFILIKIHMKYSVRNFFSFSTSQKDFLRASDSMC